MARIDALFKLMSDRGASDLHLSTGSPPIFRLRGGELWNLLRKPDSSFLRVREAGAFR